MLVSPDGANWEKTAVISASPHASGSPRTKTLGCDALAPAVELLLVVLPLEAWASEAARAAMLATSSGAVAAACAATAAAAAAATPSVAALPVGLCAPSGELAGE